MEDYFSRQFKTPLRTPKRTANPIDCHSNQFLQRLLNVQSPKRPLLPDPKELLSTLDLAHEELSVLENLEKLLLEDLQH